jgi:hypothetical protein
VSRWDWFETACATLIVAGVVGTIGVRMLPVAEAAKVCDVEVLPADGDQPLTIRVRDGVHFRIEKAR